MDFKKIFGVIGFILLVYILAGIYLAFFTEYFEEVNDFELIAKVPVYLYSMIKNWVVSL